MAGKKQILTAFLFTSATMASILSVALNPAAAEADGPDFYRVKGVASNDTLNIRSEPSASSQKLGEIPYNANGVKNLGCKGSLNFADWQKASPAQRKAAAASRWCKVSFDGKVGWVAGRFLAEGDGPATPVSGRADIPEQPILRKLSPDETLERVSLRANGSIDLTGTIRGYKHKVYAVTIGSGDTLTVRFMTRSSSAYFNLIDGADASGAAVHRGDVAGNTATVTPSKPTTYLIQPYLFRSVARRGRNAQYTFALSHKSDSSAPQQKSGIQARFDATGFFKCSAGKPSHDLQCGFWVRRANNGAATISVKRPARNDNRTLEFTKNDVKSPQPGRLTWGKKDDTWYIGIDNNEFYVVPEAAIVGG